MGEIQDWYFVRLNLPPISSVAYPAERCQRFRLRQTRKTGSGLAMPHLTNDWSTYWVVKAEEKPTFIRLCLKHKTGVRSLIYDVVSAKLSFNFSV
jgi:hypothetical protein